MNSAGTLVGVVLAAAIALAALLAPQVFPGPKGTNAPAEEQATLATRQLFRYAQNAAELKRVGDLTALQSADFNQLVTTSSGGDEAARTPFDRLREHFAESARSLRSADEKRSTRGIAPSEVRPPSIDAGGVKNSVAATLKWLEENEKLLAAAEANARSAATAAGTTVRGVAQPLGMALLMRASEALDAATRLRGAAEARRRMLLSRVLDWKFTAADTTAAGDMSPTKASTALREELTKLATQKTAVDANVTRLTAAIAERETQLAAVKSSLTDKRKRLMDLETAGFKAGNDSSFETYRSAYRALGDELAVLEEQEQQWSLGGMKGANFAGEDMLTGAVEGGEAVPGLAELQREHEIAQSIATQLESGVAALQARIGALDNAAAACTQQKQRGEAALKALRTEMDTLLTAIGEVTTQADERETAAITAAQNAARAFADSRAAADQWKSDAGRDRGELDPNGQNERLKLIQADRYADLIGASAEVTARLIEARVHAQRVQASSAHLKALEEMQVTIKDSEIKDRAAMEGYIQAARDAGAATLKEAADLCKSLTNTGNTAWIGHGLLGATHYLWSQIDAAGADAHRADAIQSLDTALEKREKSPYLQDHLHLRDLLKAGEG